MRVTKDATGQFILEDEPFVIEGVAAEALRSEIERNDPPSPEHSRDLADCARLFTEAWAKREAR